MAMIELRHLTKTYGTGESAVKALDDVSLEIEQGEIFGIIGLSGAGKSTLVRCMNLLERPTEGRVVVDGGELTALTEQQLRRALRTLTVEERLLIHELFYNGKSERELSAMIAVPQKTINDRKRKILAKLRRQMES